MKRRSNLLIVLLITLAGLLVGLGFLIRQNTIITEKKIEASVVTADNARSACADAREEADRIAQEAAEAAKQQEVNSKEAQTEEPAETEEVYNAAEKLDALQGEDMSELALRDPLPEHRIIFVGDSRTVGMGNAEADRWDKCIYIGESGEGLAWFLETGYDRMAKVIKNRPNDPVVINLGVNDLSEISHYLDLYATFKDDFPKTKFYFMSVNPVTVESENVTNDEIREFNRILKKTYGSRYLDVNAIMTKDGFESVDGVHYSEDTYCDIHDYVVRALFSQD